MEYFLGKGKAFQKCSESAPCSPCRKHPESGPRSVPESAWGSTHASDCVPVLREDTSAAAEHWSASAWGRQLQEWKLDLEKKGVPMDAKPWTSVAPKPEGLVCTARICGLLDAVCSEVLPVSELHASFVRKQHLLQHVYVDLSQNPARRKFSRAGMCPTMTTSTRLFSFHRNGLLLPLEMMLLQGHRRTLTIPRGLSPEGLKTLAGEGMCVPCLGTISGHCAWQAASDCSDVHL